MAGGCQQLSLLKQCSNCNVCGPYGDCAAGESSGSEGGAERSGKVNLAAAVLLAALASPDAADQLH